MYLVTVHQLWKGRFNRKILPNRKENANNIFIAQKTADLLFEASVQPCSRK